MSLLSLHKIVETEYTGFLLGNFLFMMFSKIVGSVNLTREEASIAKTDMRLSRKQIVTATLCEVLL